MMRIVLLLATLVPAFPALAQHEQHEQHEHHEQHASPQPAPGPHAGHAADAIYGTVDMERARAQMGRMHGNVPASRVLVERLEVTSRGRRQAYALDAEAWYGGDIDRLWLKAEAEGAFQGAFEGAELQLLWSHAIGPFFDLRTGARLDVRSGPERGHLVVGVQGLAPYWIEVDASAFLSDRGDLTARVEVEHDVRVTRKLIFQPRVEAMFALDDIPDERIGSGLSEISLGARLRYQLSQRFAPYAGVEYERAVGETRRYRRGAGERGGGVAVVAGVRFWF